MSDIAPFQYTRRYFDDFAEPRDRELEEFLSTKVQQRLTSVVTSTTRPTVNLTRGQTIFETDTGNTLVWYGATTGWQKPWNMAWGYATHVTVSADSSGFTGTLTDLNVSVTFTTVGARQYRASLLGAHISSTVGSATGGERTELRITNGSNTLLTGAQARREIPNASILVPIEVIGTDLSSPAAGSVTYKLRAIRDAGTGTHTLKAGAISTTLLVEDIGPAGSAPNP